jgi:hypothetical protein
VLTDNGDNTMDFAVVAVPEKEFAASIVINQSDASGSRDEAAQNMGLDQTEKHNR